MQVDIWSAKVPIVEKGISSNNNYTESFCQNSFCSVHSTNTVEPYFSLGSSETVFLYKLQADNPSAKVPVVEKETSSNKNYREHSAKLLSDLCILLTELNFTVD